MKRIEIEKKLHAAGVTLGDRIIVTIRLSRGQRGERAVTLTNIGKHVIYGVNRNDCYSISYNEIENVEPANV